MTTKLHTLIIPLQTGIITIKHTHSNVNQNTLKEKKNLQIINTKIFSIKLKGVIQYTLQNDLEHFKALFFSGT